MKLAVLKETAKGETRVAATPESIKKFKTLGLDVTVESGAGGYARIADADRVLRRRCCVVDRTPSRYDAALGTVRGEASMRGRFNSSITRVRPFFRALHSIGNYPPAIVGLDLDGPAIGQINLQTHKHSGKESPVVTIHGEDMPAG